MTTLELRDALNNLMDGQPETASLEVSTEGCDCDGTASRLEVVPARSFERGGQTITVPAFVYVRR